MTDTQDKRIIGAGVCAGGMVNPCKDDLLPTKPVKHPKTREEWKARRDWCLFQGNTHEAEWIDRKILYPIGNIINGKYPDDEKFKCSCGSHVAIRHIIVFGKTQKCVVCGLVTTDFDTLKKIEEYVQNNKTESAVDYLKDLEEYTRNMGVAP